MKKPRFSIYEGELGRGSGKLARPDYSSLPPMDYLGYVTPLGSPKDHFHVSHVRFPWEPLPGRHVRTVIVRECCNNLAMVEQRMEPSDIARALTLMGNSAPKETRPDPGFIEELPDHLQHYLTTSKFTDPFDLVNILTALAKVEKGITRVLCAFEAGRVMQEVLTLSGPSATDAEHENPLFADRARPGL